MAIYRGVVRHIRYWRGNPHRWSTVYHFQGTPSSAFTATDCQTLLTKDDGLLFAPSGAGGTYECDFYSQASGGVPIASYRAFDPAVPSSWVAPSHAGWAGTPTGYETAAETALQVYWAAGFSSSGKPVKLRKWIHSVPLSANTTGAGADVSTPSVSSLTTYAGTFVGLFSSKGMVLSSSTGRLAGSASVNPVYGSHQMPRGRKRKISTSSARAQSDFGAILNIINGSNPT